MVLRCLFLLSLLFLTACNCGGRITMVQPKVTVEPRAIDFGVVAPGDRSLRTLRLTVEGAAVSVRSLSVRDDSRRSFLFGSPTGRLEVGIPADVAVTYAPASEGAEGASLVITFDELPELVVPLVGRSLRASVDGGQLDAGAGDAGSFDAGADAGRLDAGADAGPEDGGDGGATSDAGLADAGGLDGDGGGFDGGLFVYDGGECPGVTRIGHARWPTFGSANLIELHWEGTGYGAFFYANESWFGSVDPQGREVPGTRRQVTGTPSSLSVYARAARGPSSYGLVYTEALSSSSRQCTFARATPTGALITGSVVPIPNVGIEASCSIAYNPLDDEWGVFGTTDVSGWFVRLSGSGTLIAGSQQLIVPAPASTRNGVSRTMGFAGDRWVLTWATPGGVMLVEVDRTGVVQAPSLTTVSGSPSASIFDPAVVLGNGQYLVTWQDNRFGLADLRFARVSVGGGVVAGSERVLSSRDSGIAASADSAWNGQRWFVAFTKQPVGAAGRDQRIAVTTVDADSNFAPPRVVTCAPGDDFNPRVTWNGLVQAVGYTHQTGIAQEGRVLIFP